MNHLEQRNEAHADLTELEALRLTVERHKKQLEDAERIKQLATVAPSVVHDIRNSLGVISSTAQFVLSKLNPSDKEKGAWELVNRNVEGIKKILTNYLRLARQTQDTREIVSLNEIVNHICEFIDSQARGQNVRIEKNLDAALPVLQLNAHGVEASVLNISLNAMEAMGADGTLRYTTEVRSKSPKHVVLAIEDSGPGIEPDLMKKIFEPFFTTKKTGTGMGLYSAKNCVENENGTLHCESAPGKGTKMVIAFPLT